MNPLQFICYSFLLVSTGWLLNSATGGLMRRVRKPHRFGDTEHYWTKVGGRSCAFTVEQLNVAYSRACALTDPRRRWLGASLWISGLFLLAVLAFSGCSKREKELANGVVASQALTGFKGDAVYAQVNSAAIPSLYANFREVLNKRGLVKWDERFDCNRFASLYIAVAQTDYAVAAWHSSTEAQALALSEVWYRVGNGGHAIVCAMTERGLVYIEPQTGKEVPAPTQIILQKW